MPIGSSLEGVPPGQDVRPLKAASDDLHPHREAVAGETAGDRQRRLSGEVERRRPGRGLHLSALKESELVGVNVPVRISGATVLPGDVVLGPETGVIFITPHLAEEMAMPSEDIRQRDIFSKQRLADGRYSSVVSDRDWIADRGGLPPLETEQTWPAASTRSPEQRPVHRERRRIGQIIAGRSVIERRSS